MSVRLTLEPPHPQRRVTVAFRLLLAIPHLMVASVMGVLALVVIVPAWFAALFTARVPDGIHDFLARVLSYMARTYGYLGLLSDRYPPFDIDDGGDWAVELEIEPPARLNRAAVLFRGVLQLWALIVSQLVTSGLTLVIFFVWLVTLVAGRMPTSAHLAVAAALRYQMRTYAYIGLLTSEYPHGLFGDKPELGDGPIIGAPAPLPTSPRITSLVLTRGAKTLLVLCLLVGVGANAANTTISAAGFGTTADLIDIDEELGAAYEEWEHDTRTCTLNGAPGCERSVQADFRFALARGIADMADLDVPDSAVDEHAAVLRELEMIDRLLGRLSETSDARAQQRLRFEIEDAKLRYDDAFVDLQGAMLFS